MAFNVDTKEWTQDEVPASRRYGRFQVAKVFVDHDYDMVRRVYAKVVPVKIEYDYASEVFNVVGLSSHFDSVNLNEPIPNYVINITRPDDVNEEPKITFIKA
jgi:hypothetical protein